MTQSSRGAAPTVAAPVHHWGTELALVLMALIWGANFAVVKFGARAIEPLAFNAARILLGTVVLGGFALAARDRWPDARTTRRLMLLGLLGHGAYQLFFIEGVTRTRAGSASLILAASPAAIALIGRLRGVERISRRSAGGIALSLAGMALVIFGSSADESGQGSLAGSLFMLGATLCWALYTVLLKPVAERVDGVHVSAITLLGGVLPILLAGLPASLRTDWTAISPGGWGAVAYSGLGAMGIAYFLWYKGVQSIGPTRTAMYANLQPLIALLVAWATLGEAPTVWQVLGAVGVLGGLLLTRN